jgi:hypothetical protein
MTIIYSDCGPNNNDHETGVSHLIAHSIPCNHTPDGTLCNVCNKIAEVESQIQDLHSRLKVLHETHRTLRIKRNNVSDIISRFPFDIASCIFVLCLPEIENRFPACQSTCLGFQTPHLPLTLSAVCNSWRGLVYSISQLWSTLSVDVDKANLQYINRRFQCSGSAPLRVQLHARSRKEDPNLVSAHVLDVITLVKQNFHRMALLCLHLSCPFLKEYFSQGLVTSNTLTRPILEELHVHCSVVHCLEPHNLLPNNTLRPHKVFVTPCSLMNIQLDWDHIRHLALDADSEEKVNPALVANALSLLPQGIRLRVVDILVDYPDNTTRLAGIVVTQNSIRCLSLYFISSEILSHVTMPHLEALTLSQMHCDSTIHLISFLRRSACPLKVMFWQPSSTLPLDQIFNEVFQYTPNLEELELHVGELSVDSEKHVVPFLERLGMVPPYESTVQLRNHSCDTLLPLLQSFVYTGPMTHAPLSRFLDIAETRSTFPTRHGQVTQRLEQLGIYRPDRKSNPPSEPDLQRIQRLNATGIRVSVLTYNPDDGTMIPRFSTDYYDD